MTTTKFKTLSVESSSVIALTAARVSLVIAVLFSILFTFDVKAQEAVQKAPDVVVKETVNAIVESIQANRELYQSDGQALFEMVENTLVPSLHVPRMAKLILGKKFASNSSEQQVADFAQEFQTFIMKTYAPALLEYTGTEKVEYEPIDLQPGSDRVKVKAALIAANGKSYPITLDMSDRKDTMWRAYNMDIAGINFISTYRSTFAPTLKKKGIDGLIADLREKNAQ